MEVMASLAVGVDPCLILPKMFVLRRCDPAEWIVDAISSDAKLNIRHDGLYRIFQSTDNSRTPCKVADESTTVDSSVCVEGDIEWESILSNS